MGRTLHLVLAAAICLISSIASQAAEPLVVDSAMHHLRQGAAREWDRFDEKADGNSLSVDFIAPEHAGGWTLRLRHVDLKFQWVAKINDVVVAQLPRDELNMVTDWPVHAGAVHQGKNRFQIACLAPKAEQTSDDILIGDIRLLPTTAPAELRPTTVDVTVSDADMHRRIPCRLTIIDAHGSLIDLGKDYGADLAVRPGVVYCAAGRAKLHLPAEPCTIYAGRGFAWSLASKSLTLKPGESPSVELAIGKVVPTPGYVSCDTHIHTFTYSRHGDATIAERMLTIAGEGIELPISTDHNLLIDYEEPARAAGVRDYFTPVLGSEVTTNQLGHFNVFPVAKGSHLLNWRAPTWAGLRRNFTDIAGDPIVILNHALDIHGGFRPFDPKRHIECTGEDLDGWTVPANAMEVLNSGATRSDTLDLFRLWTGECNRGNFLTPIGSSDSHTVATYIVGQGRTYIRCDSAEPGKIDVAQAMKSLHEGRVMVSYGLLADLTVAGRYGPGDLVPASAIDQHEIAITAKVFGPEWTHASHVTLYANGIPVREAELPKFPAGAEPAGLKWQTVWALPRPKHDLWLTLVATGPGISAPYWPMNNPYQPTSTHYEATCFACTGAVRLDVDGAGQFRSPFDYAKQIVEQSSGNVQAALASLNDFDSATASQVAGLWRTKWPVNFNRELFAGAARHSPIYVSDGIKHYFNQYSMPQRN